MLRASPIWLGHALVTRGLPASGAPVSPRPRAGQGSGHHYTYYHDWHVGPENERLHGLGSRPICVCTCACVIIINDKVCE